MRTVFRSLFLALLLVAPVPVNSAADTIKIAFIDALSGPNADIGFTSLKQYQQAVAYANANGGALGLDLELVPLDDESSAKRALENLDLAIRQGIRYVTQGNDPDITIALAKAIGAHNQENPSRAVVFLNYGDGAPQLDNEECSFWQFRFDASIAMKTRALVAAIPADGNVQSIYLLNQDNPWGQSASREMQRVLSEQRPEIRILGDELHSVSQLKDFSGYVARILDSGADAIMTADRGADLAGFISALSTSRQKKYVYILGNSVSTVPAAVGDYGAGQITGVFTWHANIGSNLIDHYAGSYRQEHGADWNGLPGYEAITMLVTSMETAHSTDPVRVARTLEGLSFLGAAGPVAIREDNHQLLQPLFVATLDVPADGGGTAAASSKFGWRTVLRLEAGETELDTSCQMQKPPEPGKPK
jgi:branched-chain amino acid transport system substrate-binding protein